MFNLATIKEAGRKAVVYLMLFVMVFNTVACDMQIDTKIPAELTVMPEAGLHEYAFDGTGGVSGQVQTISASYIAKDGTTSTSVRFDFPEDPGITVQSNDGNGFASFIFNAPGYYVVNVAAVYNGKDVITKAIHYNITSSLSSLGLKTNEDDASIGQTLRMTVGQTLTLIPIYTPATSGTMGVEWETDEAGGVISTEEVDSTSTVLPTRTEKHLRVTAREEGTTTIRAISLDNRSITKEITVVVSASGSSQTMGKSQIILTTSPENKVVPLGSYITVNANVIDGNQAPMTGEAVAFTVADENVFKVDQTQQNSVRLQAVGRGDTSVIARLQSDSEVTSSIPLSTSGGIEDLAISPYFGLLLGGEDESIPVDYYPADTVEKGIDVTVQNTSIVALTGISTDSFTLKPLSRGQTQITVTSKADPTISKTATVVVDEELSNSDRISNVAFDEPVLNFESMAATTVQAHTYVRNLQGESTIDDSLGLKFTNNDPDIISIEVQEDGHTLLVTPLRPTVENESATVEVRSTVADQYFNILTVYVEGDLQQMLPQVSSVDLLMDTTGKYYIDPYPQNAVFALAGESNTDNRSLVTLDISNSRSISSASLAREGSRLALTVKAGTTPGSSTISFLKDGETVGAMDITTTVAENYVKSIRVQRDGRTIQSLALRQDSDPVEVAVSLINDSDEQITASSMSYSFEVTNDRIIDVRQNNNILTITPKNAGETYINLTATSSGATSQLYVEVGGSAVQGTDLRSITLSKDSSTLSKDRVDTVNYTIIPYSIEDSVSVTVQADKPEIAEISLDEGNRQVTFVGNQAGSTRVTFTARYKDTIKTASFNLTVNESGDYYAIILDRDYLSYDLNQRLAQTITATVYKNGSADTKEKVVWSIEDPSIGSVTPSGASNGRSAVVGYKSKTGSTKIIASLENHPEVTASTMMEVIDSKVLPTTIRNIVLNQSSITLPLGRTTIMEYSIVPDSLQADADVTFSSSNEAVATVDEDGIVSTHALGNATISATVDASQTGGETVRASMRVNVVRDASSPSYIQLSESSVTLDMEHMDEGVDVVAEVYDRDDQLIPDASVTWTQSIASRRIARVEENGDNSITIYPQSAGSATIRVQYPGLSSVMLLVNVGEETTNAKTVTSLNPNVRDLDLFLSNDNGRSFNVYVTPVPADVTTDLDIRWSSSDPSVATVSANKDHPSFATINAVGVGNTQVIASVHDTAIQTIINVNVTQEAPGKVTAIEVSPTSIVFDLNSRELTQIKATVYYDGVADPDQDVEWTIEKALEGAVVSAGTDRQTLRISKGNKTGEGFITAKSADKSASTAVQVVESSDELSLMSLNLSATNLSINVGQKSRVYATPYPSSVGDQRGYAVEWKSLDEKVATVDNGVITGVGNGTTSIEATASYNGTTRAAVVNVTVWGESESPSYIRLSDSSIVLDQEDMDNPVEITAGVYTNKNNPVEDAEVTWTISSYAQRIVRMEEGSDANTIRLTPVSAGTATITVSYPNVPSVRLNVTVGSEIVNAGGVERLVASTSALDLWLDDEDGRTFGVYVTPVPANVLDDIEIEWTSSNRNVATVTQDADNPTFATVSAQARGNAQIIASIPGTGIRAVIEVSVTQEAPGRITAIEVSPTSIVFDLNSRSLTLIKATVYYNGVKDASQSVTWTVDDSLDEAISNPRPSGQYFRLAKGSKTGEGYITATAGDKSASVYVSTVDTTGQPTSLSRLSLSSSSIDLGIGQTALVYATPYPSEIANEPGYTVTWASSNPDVVTVDDGYLTGIGNGSATVTATAEYNGVEKVARLSVRVSEDFIYPSQIVLSPASLRFASSSSTAVDVQARILMTDGSEYELADSEEISFSVNDDSVVGLASADGGTTLTVTPKREGVAVITAEYSTLSARLNVEVGSSIESPATAPTSMTLNSSTGGLLNPPGSRSDTTTIVSVEYLPQNLSNEYKGVEWSLDSETHARILSSTEHTATLSAVSSGEAVLTATSLADDSVKAKITIVVLDKEIVIPRISLDRTSLSMEMQDSVTINAIVTRDGVTEDSGTVTFTNDSNDDNISFSASGTRGYTITTDTDQTSTFTVTASYPVGVGSNTVSTMLPVTVRDSSVEGQRLRAVSLSEDSLVMTVGETLDLDYTVEPRIVVTAKWTTSSDSIVTVDQNGIIEAVGTGNAKVTVEATDEYGNTQSDAVNISVTDEIRQSSKFASLEVSETSLTRSTLDMPYQLTLTLTGADDRVDTSTEIHEIKAYGIDGKELSNGELFEWTMIGKPGRTVELSNFKPGSAYLRFTVYDDPLADVKAGVSTSVFVNVTGEVKGISADTQYLHMAVGDQEEISVSYSPLTAYPDVGDVSWSIENSKLADGSSGNVLELVDSNTNGTTIRALALGTATVKVSYGTKISSTVEVSVEDIASLSGGVKKVTFDESFLEFGYPSTRAEVSATVHFYDGSTTKEGIVYSWKDQANDSKIATLTAGNSSCYIDPVSDGTATLVASYGGGNNGIVFKAEMQIIVKKDVGSLTPSADVMTIYTGGSARVSVTPDLEIPNTRYGWRIKEEVMTSGGDFIPIGSNVSALNRIITDPNEDNSTVVIAANDVVVDPDNSYYDENLVSTYPRKVTIETYLIDNPGVTAEMTVMVELLPLNNSYPKELSVDFSNITDPDLENFNVVTAELLDSNGDEIDGHVDWYYYVLGDDGWDDMAAGSADNYKTDAWIDPGRQTSTVDLIAYTEEDARTLYIKPQKYGIYRLKAICRENPALQQSVTINIEGEVEDIISSVGNSLNVTERGDWVSLNVTFDPEPILARDAFFVLGSYKTGTNSATAYNEDKNIQFIVNGNSIQIYGKAVTSTPMPLYVEYWDSATRANLENVEAGTMTYEDATKDGEMIASTTIMVSVVPPSKSIATINASGLDISIDPSSITGPINFSVSVNGGDWGTGESSDSSFTNWEWIEIDIVGSDSANDGKDVIYASTTPSRVNAPSSIAQGGRINFVNGTASFTLVKSAIPNEPLMVRIDLKDDYQDGVLNNPDGAVDGSEGTIIFDITRLDFNKFETILYIGGQVTNLNPGTTEFTNNGTTSSATGQVINMITGAMATIKVEYNPSYTHQKGTVWYTPDASAKDRLTYSYINNGNTNECSVDGIEDSQGPVVLRAMSIYDPWFDYRADQLNMSVEDFRATFLDTSHEQRLTSDQYRYPIASDAVQPTIYLDFQVTVSSPIDKAIFTAKAQRQINKDSMAYPEYAFMNDPTNHPDVVSESDIYCYDTSDASSASEESSSLVDAYYIEAELLPRYGYSLTYSQVDGKSIGSIDTITDIDEGENAFRFIPKGRTVNADGTYSVAYGDVIIRATSAEQNFSQDFVLHYLPSNMRVVKYIGEKDDNGLKVPADSWVDEWDVAKLSDVSRSLYGMEAVVLQQKGVDSDPEVDETYKTFPLSIVSYSENNPYYITNGVRTSESEGGEIFTRYAVKFTLMQGKNVSGEEWKSDIAHFETPDGEYLGNETDFLTMEDLSKPYINIVADSQGVAYITYTIISVDEDGQPISSSGTMNGGVMLYVISPMNQALAALINNSASASNYTYAVLISEKISKSQDYMWFLGPDRGGISEVALTSDGQESGYNLVRGRTYASFTLPAGQSISGSAFSTRKEFKSMKELGTNTSNPSLILEIDGKKLAAIAIKDGSETIGNTPNMNEVIITGDTGLPLLSENGISQLIISDNQNGLYQANLRNNSLDLSSLKNLKVYYHTGMYAVDGANTFTISLPPALESLDLSRDNLNGQILWNGSASTLKTVNLTSNSFKTTDLYLTNFSNLEQFIMQSSAPKSVTISSVPKLTSIDVTSGTSISSSDSRLVVTGSPALKKVEANNTQFKSISVQMAGESAENVVTLGNGSNNSGIGKLNTFIVTGGFIKTLYAKSVPYLYTIDSGGSDIESIYLNNTNSIQTVRVRSIRVLDGLEPSFNLQEFAFHWLRDGANINLSGLSKLYTLGKGRNAGFSYDIPGNTTLTAGGNGILNNVQMGAINGTLNLNNTSSLSYLTTGTGSGVVNATNSGLSSFSQVSTGARVVNLNSSWRLGGAVNINGGVNESIQELYISNCPITSISVTASSKLVRVDAYSCNLTNAVFKGSQISHIDVHDNELGKGELRIGNNSYKAHTFGRYTSIFNTEFFLYNSNIDWRYGTNVNYLCAYGNDIYVSLSPYSTRDAVEDRPAMSDVTFRLGYGIPSNSAMAIWDFYAISENWAHDPSATFYIANMAYAGTRSGNHGPANSRKTCTAKGTAYRYALTIGEGTVGSSSAQHYSKDYYDDNPSGGWANLYPLGQ